MLLDSTCQEFKNTSSNITEHTSEIPSPSREHTVLDEETELSQLVQLVRPAERTLLRQLCGALLRAQREVEQTYDNASKWMEDNAVLTSTCRNLEYRISQLEEALVGAGIELPLEEGSQLT